MRKLNSQFITTFVSEAGLNGQNGTYYGFVEMDRYYCMAVAEGYDGDGGRESAKLAVDAAMEAFVQKPGMSAGRIRACLKRAHRCLAEQSVRIRLKAGILVLVSDYTRFRYGVCGNVMLYAFRSAGIYHQSVTHTVYQNMAGQAAKEGTGPKEETGNVVHYLGGSGRTAVSGRLRLEDGDVLLAVTEGFWSRINKVEVLDAYESIQSVEEFLGDLQELYLRGSTEGIPCCCLAAVEVKKAYKENRALKKKILTWCLILFLILLAVSLIAAVVFRVRRRKQREVQDTVAVYEETGDQYMADLSCTLAKQEYEKAAQESKKISKNGERLAKEKELSEKIGLSEMLKEADDAYGARSYAQAREGYKKVLERAKQYKELSSLTGVLERRMKLAGTGMEIDNYMQAAALKEAEGDLESAAVLYGRAEAMLRIVEDPELLKEAQLALLRIEGQAREEAKAERAKARDEVIIDADKEAALNAILAGDLETAIAQYTKIRDSYIALEDNEKAEETTQLILSLQKQAMEEKDLKEDAIEEDRQAAFDAILAGDTQEALALLEKARDAYTELEDAEGAAEMEQMIASLKAQDAQDPGEDTLPGDSGEEDGEAAGPAGETGDGPARGAGKEAAGRPGASGRKNAPGAAEKRPGPGGDTDG